MREFAEVVARLGELERRFAAMARHGTVYQVDPAKQVVRLRFGGSDDKPYLGPWVPYGQIAGALKVHSPPSVGQQMTQFAPTGDWRQAVAMPFTWSNQNPSPSQAGDEHVLTFGSVTVTLKGEQVTIKVGAATLTLTQDKIVADVGGKQIGVGNDAAFSVGPTRLGLDDEGERSSEKPKVITDAGPAKQTEAKAE